MQLRRSSALASLLLLRDLSDLPSCDFECGVFSRIPQPGDVSELVPDRVISRAVRERTFQFTICVAACCFLRFRRADHWSGVEFLLQAEPPERAAEAGGTTLGAAPRGLRSLRCTRLAVGRVVFP